MTIYSFSKRIFFSTSLSSHPVPYFLLVVNQAKSSLSISKFDITNASLLSGLKAFWERREKEEETVKHADNMIKSAVFS